MYQLKYKNYILYDPRLADEKLIVRDPSVKLAVSKAGEMSFTVGADHPYLSNLRRMSGLVELLDGTFPIYRGRITGDTKDFYGAHKIETEGIMAALNDSIMPPFNFPEDFAEDASYKAAAASGNVVDFFFRWILAQHNSQVSTEQQIKPGVCTVTDSNNYITRSSGEYATAMSTISDKLIKSDLGGYLLIRYENDGNYLDYYAELPLTNTQTVEFAENLLDLSIEVDGTSIYTAILPEGKDGLTIGNLPDGDLTDDLVKSGKIIYSKSGVSTYGRITRHIKWDDVTVDTNLQTKAKTALANNGLSMPETITCKAVDLGWQDGIQHFRVGRMTALLSAPHGYSASYPLMELAPDILDPGNTEITIGISRSTFTQSQIDTDRKIHYEIESSREETEEFINQKTDVIQTELTNTTTLAQDTRALMLSAFEKYVETSDFEAFQQTIESELNVFADRVEISLSTITESIENVNGDLQSKFSDYNKWFRFTSEGLLIGESENGDSELTLRVDNDRIVFLQSGAEVAYFSNRKLYVTDAQFLSSLQIGNFAFVPRANGNLSFKKVVG